MSDATPPTPEETPESYERLSKQIWFTGGSLAVFAAVVTLLANIGLSTAWTMRLLLPIIAIEAWVQIVYFMHLKTEKIIIFKFLLFTMVFFVALFFLTQLANSSPLHSTLIPITK